jgi:hypothetical protein
LTAILDKCVFILSMPNIIFSISHFGRNWMHRRQKHQPWHRFPPDMAMTLPDSAFVDVCCAIQQTFKTISWYLQPSGRKRGKEGIVFSEVRRGGVPPSRFPSRKRAPQPGISDAAGPMHSSGGRWNGSVFGRRCGPASDRAVRP